MPLPFLFYMPPGCEEGNGRILSVQLKALLFVFHWTHLCCGRFIHIVDDAQFLLRCVEIRHHIICDDSGYTDGSVSVLCGIGCFELLELNPFLPQASGVVVPDGNDGLFSGTGEYIEEVGCFQEADAAVNVQFFLQFPEPVDLPAVNVRLAQ